jgi:dihydrofolate synthase/folylpolyglutamate synthase
MGLGNPRPDAENARLPGEPGVGPDLPPPFAASDEATRWLFALNRFGIRPGLARIEGLLEDLGHPERGLRVIVTAGTNGKGSTTRVLGHLLQAAGLRTAVYTSPHLLDVRERVLVDDRPLAAEEFSRRVTELKPLVEKHEASWFETLTALAVLAARDHGVDVMCCETGLGGRLDASNALPAEALLLTTIGLDHQRILGETRPEILAEKLGLLKPGVPLYCGVDAELRGQVFSEAVRVGAPVLYLDELALWDDAPGRWDLSLRERRFTALPDPGTPALRRNVALALLALAEQEQRLGTRLLPDEPAAALGNLFLPGRYQHVLREPDWILDTAHNTQALTAALEAFGRRPCAGRRVLVIGAMYDKPLAGELAPLVRACDAVVGMPVSLPRSRTADELTAVFAAWDLAPEAWTGELPARCAAAPDPGAALAALGRGLADDDAVLVTGSCFTVAETLWRLGFRELDGTRGPSPARGPMAGIIERDGP